MKTLLLIGCSISLLAYGQNQQQKPVSIDAQSDSRIQYYYGAEFEALSQDKKKQVIYYFNQSYIVEHQGEKFNPITFDVSSFESERLKTEDYSIQLKDGTTILLLAENKLSYPVLQVRTHFIIR